MLSNRGVQLEQEGDLEGASQCLTEAVARDPDLAEAWSNLGNVRRAQGMLQEAIHCYHHAILLKPDYADAHSNLGAALLDLENIEGAKLCLTKALELKPEHAQALNNMGNVHMAEGDPNKASYLYEQAINYKPDYASAHNNFGNALKELGDFQGAREEYDRALGLNPKYAEAHYNRSNLVNFKEHSELIPEPDSANPYVQFALGKAYDDRGEYEHAWKYFQVGNWIKRQTIDYREKEALELIERVKSVFTLGLFERFKSSGNPSTRPLFIIGFPRCGSTLVEQILSSHPKIHGAGELTILEMMQGPDWPESVGQWSTKFGPSGGSDVFAELGDSYLARLPKTDNPFTTDKLLGNFLRVGLIHLMFPNARIIHVSRDPLDTCLSCYQHLFTRGVWFSYDLAELGRYYKAYESLMDHWAITLPQLVYSVSYEELVRRPDIEIGGMLGELGLQWDDACLEFWKNPRAVRTASNVQVRQPLFTSSVGKWKHYEFGLEPLKDALGLATV